MLKGPSGLSSIGTGDKEKLKDTISKYRSSGLDKVTPFRYTIAKKKAKLKCQTKQFEIKLLTK